MLPSHLHTARQVLLYHDTTFKALVQSNQASPFLLQHLTLSFLLVLTYLLFDHRKSPALTSLRYPVFGGVVAIHVHSILYHRAKTPAGGLLVGISSVFIILSMFALLVANDCQKDFARLQRITTSESVREANHGLTSYADDGRSDKPSGDQNGNRSNSGLRKRIEDDPETNGTHGSISEKKMNGKHESSTDEKQKVLDEKDETWIRESQLYWQTYPDHGIIARLLWSIDLLTSFRGIGWNWQTPGIPPPPSPSPPAAASNNSPSSSDDKTTLAHTTSRTGVRRYRSRHLLVRHALIHYCVAIVALDMIVCIMHNDPYFWGFVSAPAPSHLSFLIGDADNGTNIVLLRSYRLLTCLAAVYAALFHVFSLGPIVFVGILGSSRLGLYGEAWMNPLDSFGSFRGVWEHGLAGWWSGYWHQMFRFTFEQPAITLLHICGVENKRSLAGRILMVTMVFFSSGVLHATAAYTELGPTSPLRGSMVFFLLQAPGVIFQSTASKFLWRAGIMEQIPKFLRRTGNVVLVLVWMYHTAPFLTDDFAKGGAWLYEPTPISVSRGLGFGPADEGWFAWWYSPVWWYKGKTWYESGLAF